MKYFLIDDNIMIYNHRYKNQISTDKKNSYYNIY